MTCFHPLSAYRSPSVVSKSGKAKICFVPKGKPEGETNAEWLRLPCGQCVGCRIDRSKASAVRCVHEAMNWEANCFITLTFNDDCLNSERTLKKADFQLFMKRLRKNYKGLESIEVDVTDPSTGEVTAETRWPIRYYHCGEYGSDFKRPHHHACLFNFTFPDLVLWDIRDGVRLYRSKVLEKLWPFGYCTVGEVTWQSAAYVARYVMKKMTGSRAADHYDGRLPEYNSMSLKPGLGAYFFQKFPGDIYPKDFVNVFIGSKRIKVKTPAYYDLLYDRVNPSGLAKLKAKRKLAMLANCEEYTPERLAAKERVCRSNLKRLLRSYENGTKTVQPL